MPRAKSTNTSTTCLRLSPWDNLNTWVKGHCPLPGPGRAALVSLFLVLTACGTTPPPVTRAVPVVEMTPGVAVPVVEEVPVERVERVVEGVEPCVARFRAGLGGLQDGPDAVLYQGALKAERIERYNDARLGYFQIIQKYPQSAYVPLAYFAFGELFLRDSVGDPSKFPLAEQSFLEVLKYRSASNPAFPAAFYRLAEIYRRTGDFQRALSLLKRGLETYSAEPGWACAQALAPASRAMMVTVYADAGRPEVAFEFFRRLGGDAPGEPTDALLMSAALAELYLVQNKKESAVAVLQGVPVEQYGAPFCTKEDALMAKLRGPVIEVEVERLDIMHKMRCAR